MQHFTELKVWDFGLELVKEIYLMSKKLPKEEIFGLTSQMKRSSTSVLANLAEGFGRFTYADKTAKYVIARGECYETEAHVRIAVALNFVKQSEAERALDLICTERKLLSGLITASRNNKT